MTVHPDVVGIDVSKHTLDVFDEKLGRWTRCANAAPAVAELVGGLAGRFVVLEATGDYDLVLRRALEAAGVAYARVNPAQARAFARAAGILAKTDRVDARLLARFGLAMRPSAEPPHNACRERLARLHKRRDQLVDIRKQERTRRTEAQEADLACDVARHLAWLDGEIADLDRRIAETVAAHEELRQGAGRLRSLPGIGPVAATTLLALMPELGARSPKTIAALAGLAPLNHDSGLHRGKRAIRGGRRRVRQALYMASVTAVRSNTRFARLYERLRAAGKPAKLALIAVARKLLVTANAILRDQTNFA